jgi:hypothetical protein
MSVGKLKSIGKTFSWKKSGLQTTCIERTILENRRLKLCQYMSDRISVLHILLTPMRQVSWLMRVNVHETFRFELTVVIHYIPHWSGIISPNF